MKTVIARFQELKKSPLEIGEVDGEVVDANKIETALKTVGVALRDTNGQFRNLDEVFLELSSKWNTLDKNTQRYIATIAAGSRQQSRFIAMMQDYEHTQELVSAANNAEGASTEQYNKTLESLETQLTQLKNAWDEFTMGLMNSELIKIGVKILTSILNIINKITGVLGDTGSAMSKIALLVAALKLGDIAVKRFIMSLRQTMTQEGPKAGEAYGNGLIGAIKKKIAQAKGLGKNGGAQPLTEQQQAAQQKYDKARKKREQAEQEVSKGTRQKGQLNIFKTNEEAAKRELDAANANAEQTAMAVQQQQQLEAAYNATAMAAMAASMALGIATTIMEKAGASKDAIETVNTLSNGLGIMSMILIGVPPLLKAIGVSVKAIPIIGWIAAAIAALITLYKVIRQYVKTDSEKLAELQDAANAAGEQATAAKKKYDELLNSQTEYNKLQETLDNLTYGTQEWKTALIEANNQVLELLRIYPKLIQYLERGSQGQLTISDEGWDAVIEQQQQVVARAQAHAAISQMNVSAFKNVYATHKLEKDLTKKQTKRGDTDYDIAQLNSEAALPQLADLYRNDPKAFTLGANGEYRDALKKLAEQTSIAVEDLYDMSEAIGEYVAEVDANTAAMRAQAKVALQAGASESFGIYQYSGQILDTFANTMTSDSYKEQVQQQGKNMVGNKNVKTDEFKNLADKYDVDPSKLTGDDKKDLKTLYGAMKGLSDEELKNLDMSKKELAQAIAEMENSRDLTEKMNDVQARMATLSKDAQRKIAMTMSESGRSMTKAMVDSLSTNGTIDETKVRAVLEQQAKELGYDSVGAYADALGKSTQELINETKESGESAATAMDQAKQILINAGLTTTQLYDKLTSEAQKSLAKHLDVVADASGTAAAERLTNELNGLLDKLSQEDRDAFIKTLNATNWKDADALNELPSIFEKMDLVIPTDQLNTFLTTLKDTAKSIPSADFDTLKKKLQTTGEVIKNITSGEQGRNFNEETYKKLISADKTLASQFYQNLNGEFVYLGGSMDDLGAKLQQLNKTIAQQATDALRDKLKGGKLVGDYNEKGNSIDDYLKSGELDQRKYLRAYIESAKARGINLSNLNISRLSNDTNVNDLDKDAVKEVLTALKNLQSDYETNSNSITDSINVLANEFEQDEVTMNSLAASKIRNILQNSSNLDEISKKMLEGELTARTNAIASQVTEAGVSDNDVSNYVQALEKAKESKGQDANANKIINDFEKRVANLGTWKKVKSSGSSLMKEISDMSDGYENLATAMAKVDKAQDMVSDFKITVENEQDADDLVELAMGFSQADWTSYQKLLSRSYQGWTQELQDELKGFTSGARYDASTLTKDALAKAEQLRAAGLATFEKISDELTVFRMFNETELQAIADSAGTVLEKWENPYNWLYNINERINGLIRERERLERAWEKQASSTDASAFNASITTAKNNMEAAAKQIGFYREQALAYVQEAAQLTEGNRKYADFYNYDVSRGELVVDYKAAEAAFGNNADEGEAFEEFIGKLEENRDGLQETIDAMNDLADELKDYRTKGQEAYISLINEIREALVAQYQAEIDKLSSINDTINEVQSAIVDKIQEQIDDARSAREREEAKRNLENQYAQLAYLQASGASALDILKLQDEISSAEQDYTDSLIDSGINEITKANEYAADQRQQQIDLAQAQLDNYATGKQSLDEAIQIYQEAIEELSKGLSIKDTKIFEFLNNTSKVVTAEEIKQFQEDLANKFSTSALYADKATRDKIDNNITTLNDAANKLNETIKDWKEGNAKQNTNPITKEDFNTKLDQIIRLLNGDKTWKSQSDAQVFGREVLSKEEFNEIKDNDEQKAALSDYNSYQDYLNAEQKHYQTNGSSKAVLADEIRKEAKRLSTPSGEIKTGNGGGTNDGQGNPGNVWRTYEEAAAAGFANIKTASEFAQRGGSDKEKYGTYQNYLKAQWEKYASNGTKTDGNSNTLVEIQKGQELSNSTRVNIKNGKNTVKLDGGKKAIYSATERDWQESDSADHSLMRLIKFTYTRQDSDGYVELSDSRTGVVMFHSSLNEEDAKELGLTNGKEGDIAQIGNDYYYYGWVPKDYTDKNSEAHLAWTPIVGSNFDGAAKEWIKYLPVAQYKTGGLADFTGPAWLDGTKSSPELVLNSTDTANFIQLKDILSSVLHNVPNKSQNTNQGNNYYDIDISVDEIADDYDVDAAADRIRELIVNDAMYRNVNAVNNIR